jgi:hypothetical protein
MDSFEVKEMTLVYEIGVVDGTVLFDTMTVSEDMPVIERNFKGRKWYKHYAYDCEMNDNKCCDDDLIITMMVPLIGGGCRRTAAHVHFDFELQIVKVKHISSYAISDRTFSAYISHATGLDISTAVRTDIEVLASIAGEKPDLDVLCDIIMNDCEASKYFSLKERFTIVPMKTKYSINMQCGLVTFKRGDNKIITISNIKSENELDIAIEHLTFLLNRYKDVRDEFMVQYSVLKEERKTAEHLTKTFALREEVPELFIPGYARECSIKPMIIPDSQEEEYKSKGISAMRYPLSGPHSRLYVCDPGHYPGLRRNRLANKDVFEFLPCCYVTDHSKRPESNYYKYINNLLTIDDRTKRIIRFKPLQPLEPGVLGSVPRDLQELAGSRELVRRSIRKSKSSALFCISPGVSRKDLKCPPQICLQELWYLTEEEILQNLRDETIFLDPTLYCRALEYIFSVNIYVFDVDQSNGIKMSIPLTKGGYIWEHEYEHSIIILCYRDSLPYPHCELVVGEWNNNIKYHKEQITTYDGSVKPTRASKQKIDSNGKCVLVMDNGRWVKCLWRPLAVSRELTKDVSESYMMHMNKLRAYFVHDLYLMCKRWHVNNITVVTEEPNFVPMIMKERFSNRDEFIEYYSSMYPSLFLGESLFVTRKVLRRLVGCYDNTMIYYSAVTDKQFNRRRNSMVTILESSV